VTDWYPGLAYKRFICDSFHIVILVDMDTELYRKEVDRKLVMDWIIQS